MELTRARFIVVAAFASLVGCANDTTGDGADLGTDVIVGREFVDQRGCAMCHQSPDATDGTLSGQTSARPGTSAYAGNLTPDRATGLGAWADIAIVRAMRYGVDNQQAPLCPPMPHYDGSDPARPFMTDVEAAAIVTYLRSLPAVSRSVPASMCPPLKPPPPIDMAAPVPLDMAMSPQDD